LLHIKQNGPEAIDSFGMQSFQTRMTAVEFTNYIKHQRFFTKQLVRTYR